MPVAKINRTTSPGLSSVPSCLHVGARPAAVTPHGRLPRGLGSVPRSLSHEGRFGRMFRNLPPFEPDDQDLLDLAASMIENDVDVEGDANAPSNNAPVAAG